MKRHAWILSLLLAPVTLSAAYTYWLTDYFGTLNTTTWEVNGSPTGGATGFHRSTTPDGSAILKSGVPGGSSNYEVRTQLTLAASGGSYITYLRASLDARINPTGTPVGSFIALEVKNPTFSNGTCSATLNAWRGTGGTLTLLAATTGPCSNGMEVRAVAAGSGWVRLYLNEVLYFAWVEPVITTGLPGVGGFDMPAGNGISRVDLGVLDTTAPSALPSTSISTAVFAERVEMQWTPADDGPNGIGILGYHHWRNGNYLGLRRSAEIVDLTATASTTYSYWFQPEDFHANLGGITTISVTTPAAGNIDPRRTGVRPLGTYWGGLGEQIDLQSGNVNFSMPLFKAQARGGWGVTFALSYNSQNWRRDTAGTARTWNHGRDIGYGYGWRFMAGR